MEDDYSSDVKMFMNTPTTQQQDIDVVIPQVPMNQETLRQQPYQQPPLQQSQQAQQAPYKSNNILDNLNMMNNGKEYLLTVVIIASLFILFSSKTFRGLLGKVSFLNMANGEYNLVSMAIVGVLFAVIYLIAKLYIL